MPLIDFYVFEETSGLKAWHASCKVIEKTYAKHPSIFVCTATEDEAEKLDNLLWTFRDDSFLPHARYSSLESDAPIQIDSTLPNVPNKEVLINISQTFHEPQPSYKKVIEIVFSDPTMQQLARERFKRYREQGFNINTFKMKAHEL